MTDSEPLRPRRRTVPLGVRHGQLKKSHPFATLAKILVAVVGVAAVSMTSVAAIAVWDVASSVKPGVHLVQLPGHTQAPIPNVGAIQGGVNLLLTGTDTRSGQGGAFSSSQELDGSSGAGNNDVNILIHIAQNHQSVTVVSIPRDLEIPIPECPGPNGGTVSGTSQAMINTTLARGGLACDVLTVEKLTGLSIPFAAEITFDGVTEMSNAVGGVTVCLATPVKDNYTNPPLNLAAGNQTIEGAEALSFLRSRHGVGDGSDLGRISNQQVFMSALARKIVAGGVLTNPLELYPLAKAAVSNMTLSDTLTSPTTLVEIGLAIKDVGLQNVVFLQYPAVSDPQNPNRVIPDSYAAPILDAALVADQPVTLSGGPGRAAVLSTPAPGAPTPTPTPTATTGAAATPSPTAPPTGPAAVQLPSSVTGQTAAEQTCTKGNE
jgi:LCP family protein required for cell wall assembly